MDISKPLHDDIHRVENQLKSAIQNHQMLIVKLHSNPSDVDIKKQLSDIQQHIKSLGECQRVLLEKVRLELGAIETGRIKETVAGKQVKDAPHPLRAQSDNVPPASILLTHRNRFFLKGEITKQPTQNAPRPQEFITLHRFEPYEHERVSGCAPIEHNSVSQLENRKENSDANPVVALATKNESGGIKKRILSDSTLELCLTNKNAEPPLKRPKQTLQAAPRPSSPAVTHINNDCCPQSSSDADDSQDCDHPPTKSHDPLKVEFVSYLGLVSMESLMEIKNKKGERRRRRASAGQHHIYSNLWDLTVKRNRNKHTYEAKAVPPDANQNVLLLDTLGEVVDEKNVTSSIESKVPFQRNSVCIVCRREGDDDSLDPCANCQPSHNNSTNHGIEVASVVKVTPQAQINGDNMISRNNDISTTYAERLMEKERLLKIHAGLKEGLESLQNRANYLSTLLANKTMDKRTFTAEEEKTWKGIIEVIKFVRAFQGEGR